MTLSTATSGVRTYDLYLADEDVQFNAILPCPERICVAWHKHARGVYELLDEKGHGRYGEPDDSLWQVREYERTRHVGDWASYKYRSVR